MFSRYYTLRSPLPPEQCADRLKDVVANEGSWFGLESAFSRKPLVGSVYPTFVRLRKRNRYVNSFQPTLSCSLEAHGGGTRLDFRVGIHPFTIVVAGIYIFCTLCILTASVVSGIASLMAGGSFPVNTALFVSCIGLAIPFQGWALARGEAAFLVDFLTKWLEAEDFPAAL